MEFTEDFELPTIEVTTKPVPEVQANDEAFYAAGSYGTDPVNNYTKMYGELTQDGYSQSLEDAKKMWMGEQDTRNKEAVLGLITIQQYLENKRLKFYLFILLLVMYLLTLKINIFNVSHL